METTIEESKRMEMILYELSLSPFRLTKELNLSSAAIYHVLNGKNKISMNLIDKICQKYPQVNKKFLIKGTGEPLIEEKTNIETEYLMVKKQDIEGLKKDIKNLYELINQKLK